MSDYIYSGDRAVTFLRQIAELIGIDNLPAPITVAVWNRSVLVREGDLPAWCKALDVDVPAFVPSEHDESHAHEFARVDALGFTLKANRPVSQAVAA